MLKDTVHNGSQRNTNVGKQLFLNLHMLHG